MALAFVGSENENSAKSVSSMSERFLRLYIVRKCISMLTGFNYFHMVNMWQRKYLQRTVSSVKNGQSTVKRGKLVANYFSGVNYIALPVMFPIFYMLGTMRKHAETITCMIK